MRNQFRSWVGVAVACLFYALSARAGVGGVSFNLIVSPGLSNGLFATIGTPTTQPGITSWPVTVDIGALGTLPASVLLNLPGRSAITLIRGRYEHRGTGAFLWTGNGGDCSVVLNAAPQAFGGVLSCLHANYGISGDPDALRLDRYDPNPFGPPAGTEDATPENGEEMAVPGTEALPPPTPLVPDNVIDVLVLYQEPVRVALEHGGSGRRGIYLFAQQCVDNLQHAIDDSLASASVRLAGVSEISRTFYGSVVQDWNFLVVDPGVARLRDLWAADVVVYLTYNGGVAYGTSIVPYSTAPGETQWPAPGLAFAPYAFAVVQYNTALNDSTNGQPQEPYVFLHEFAHVIGTNHNYEDTNNLTPLAPWAYGRWAINAQKGSARTIMSNPQQNCLDHGLCTRIRYYSNPDVTVDWFHTGLAVTANNARIIREYWNEAATYRTSVGRIFYDGFDP
jgi:hypothetical protein